MSAGRKRTGGLLRVRARANYLRAESLLPLTGLPAAEGSARPAARGRAERGMDGCVDRLRARAARCDPGECRSRRSFSMPGYASVNGVPGLRGIAGSIAGNERGGQVIIDTNVGVFHWPTQFPRPAGTGAPQGEHLLEAHGRRAADRLARLGDQDPRWRNPRASGMAPAHR